MKNKEKIRQLVADLMKASGCGCCRNEEKYGHARKELALMLDVPKNSDNSEYDFYQFCSESFVCDHCENLIEGEPKEDTDGNYLCQECAK